MISFREKQTKKRGIISENCPIVAQTGKFTVILK